MMKDILDRMKFMEKQLHIGIFANEIVLYIKYRLIKTYNYNRAMK